MSGVHKSSQVYHRRLDIALQHNMDDLWLAFTKALHTVFAAGSRIDHTCLHNTGVVHLKPLAIIILWELMPLFMKERHMTNALHFSASHLVTGDVQPRRMKGCTSLIVQATLAIHRLTIECLIRFSTLHYHTTLIHGREKPWTGINNFLINLIYGDFHVARAPTLYTTGV